MSSRRGRARHVRKPATQRQLRVGELVRHALVDILARGHLRDPALEGPNVTLSRADLSPDLRHATVYCTSLGGADDEAVVEGLNRSRAYLRGELGRAITLKFTPDLKFELDRSFARAEAVDALLRSPKVARDLAAGRDEDGDV
jgi:ribosome-binding factor A